jgi:hypothetical protein
VVCKCPQFLQKNTSVFCGCTSHRDVIETFSFEEKIAAANGYLQILQFTIFT